MTTIHVSCNECANIIDLTPRQVRLVSCNVQVRSFYAFTCIECGEPNRKRAGGDVIALLTSGGVVAEPLYIPPEFMEAKNGPVIDHDYLLDFHRLLEGINPDVIATFASTNATLADLL